jgi:hypothetical protein
MALSYRACEDSRPPGAQYSTHAHDRLPLLKQREGVRERKREGGREEGGREGGGQAGKQAGRQGEREGGRKSEREACLSSLAHRPHAALHAPPCGERQKQIVASPTALLMST